jgi:glucose-1-phosphate thymidylyltransferase
MKGIVLAGGSGTRLHPMTLAVSKQMLPVYNKPMIYYPLATLMLAGIRDILIITTPHDQNQFQRLLGDGSSLGVNFSYAVQPEPKGLAEAFIIGKDFIDGESVCLILGDNIFYGNHLSPLLSAAANRSEGATLFGYAVKDPHRYGVVEIDDQGKPIGLEEKPLVPKSNIAVTGLYFYDQHVVEMAEGLQPSARGELEITDLNRLYLERGNVHLEIMGRGFAWLDAGTYSSMMQASQFVQVIEEREGSYIAALEEIAFHQGFIDASTLADLGKRLGRSPYGEYLIQLAANSYHTSLRERFAYAN